MSNAFEDARHQGYSAADMAADMAEKMARCQALGCLTCAYKDRISATCDYIIDQETIYEHCPYRKEA